MPSQPSQKPCFQCLPPPFGDFVVVAGAEGRGVEGKMKHTRPDPACLGYMCIKCTGVHGQGYISTESGRSGKSVHSTFI